MDLMWEATSKLDSILNPETGIASLNTLLKALMETDQSKRPTAAQVEICCSAHSVRCRMEYEQVLMHLHIFELIANSILQNKRQGSFMLTYMNRPRT